MPERTDAPAGAPCWVDLMTSDQERIEAFYGELFGWTVLDPGQEYGGYRNFLKDGVPVAGCMVNTPEMATPDVWSVYLRSDDADATVAAAEAAGGTPLFAPMDVLELGRMSMLIDPGGAAVGVWQPGDHRGFGLVAEPGAPAWFEIHTRDFEPTVDFYRKVFGWDVHVASDTPEFRYSTLGEGDEQEAGIMDASAFLPEGVPAHWSVYFAVESTDAAVARAVALGGSVLMAPEDSPYGRLAQLADPTGATFKLVG